MSVTSDKPIPMRPRASQQQPITFPARASFDERIRRNMYRVLYHVFRSDVLLNLDTLSYQQFCATIEQLIAAEEEEGEA